MSKGPVGVFDSGLGGLTVVKALKESLPNESILYFGDTARLPYGVKSRELIIEYSVQITEFLIQRGAKLIIVACNTATAMALKELRKRFKETKIIGVIEPGSKQAYLDTSISFACWYRLSIFYKFSDKMIIDKFSSETNKLLTLER